ncbi:MAG: hypothetical protein IID36_06950 [Planctomycetes bacterium]|nr:hypothetical protein [Planctomycetota bacterium]
MSRFALSTVFVIAVTAVAAPDTLAQDESNGEIIVESEDGTTVPAGSTVTLRVKVRHDPISPPPNGAGVECGPFGDIPDLKFVRLDTSDTPAGFTFLSFTFDPSAFPGVDSADYVVDPTFPKPTVEVVPAPNFPLMTLPTVATTYAIIEVQVPIIPGLYTLDLIKNSEFTPGDAEGGLLTTGLLPDDEVRREKNAKVCLPCTECLENGILIFEVVEPIPTVTEWGMIALTLSLLLAGGAILARRKRVPVRA